MIWIFRALMGAGLIVAVLAVAVSGLIFVNFDAEQCAEACDPESRFVLFLPAAILGVLGLITALVARRFIQHLKLERMTEPRQ